MIRTALLTTALLASGLVTGTSTVQALDDTPWTLPERPSACTEADAASGDVGHCLLSFYRDPSETGWGVPPAPGVGDGWEFSGSRYNGSPALETWEAERIAANTETVAGMAPGQFESHVAAQAIMEGFLAEITANGYEVYHANAYSFRCTNSNGGWDCPTGDPDHLSYHAWGLAVDMNSNTNPIRRYSSQDGVTACQTPMETDMPRWMVQTAEKWGLYWGGYGWSSGCIDTSTERESVFRDPPHFEFRGTVEHAEAIIAFNHGEDLSLTCFTVIDADGNETERCNRTGRPGAEWRLPVDTDVPEGTEAVMINLTATESNGPGFLTLEDCGPRDGERSTSPLTFAADDSMAAMAVVPVDESGRFCVYHSTSVHSIVDVLGNIGADGEPLWFDPSIPKRLTDSRADGACLPGEECRPGPVPGRSAHAVPTDDERPRIANVAVVEGSGPGYLQAGVCDGVGEEHLFSNLNYLDDAARSNLALVGNGESGSCVFALTEAHVLVDELGALDAAEGYGWALEQPRRALDTRECADAWCDDRPEARTVIELDLDTEAPGAAIAITVTEPEADGFVTVGPCEEFEGVEDVDTSNLNHRAGQTVTNLALVDLDEGNVCIYTLAAAHVIIDVQANLTAEQDAGLVPTEPTRVHDSREI